MWTGCGCRSMTIGSDRVGVDSVRAGSRPSSPQPRLCNDGPITMAVYTLNSTDCVRVCTDICWYREELSNESRTVSEVCISRATHPPLPRLDTWALSLSAVHNCRGQQMQTCVCRRQDVAHRVGGENVDEWRPIRRPAHHQRSCQSALGRVRGQGAAFEPPRSPHQRVEVLWV